MQKYKVAFFAEILIEDFDGASRTMFQLIKRIPKEQFEFIFFCAMPPKEDIGFEVVQIPSLSIPFNTTYKFGFPYFSKSKITNRLDDFQPDIIHFASPTPLAALAKKYAIKNNIPVTAIYHTHFIAYIKYYFRHLPFLIPYFYKMAARITRQFYNAPNQVYVPTQGIIDDLQFICQIDNPNLKLWQRGIDPELFHPEKNDPAVLKDIVKNDHPNILFASRLVWEKNLQTLIDLYKYYQSKNVAVNFIIAGDGVARKAAEQQMPNAHFLGMVDHETLSVLYASSDVYFFPSDTETFGNVVIEAMAAGLPCVVANGGGPKSFIKNGVNGFLCPTNDVTAYFEKIQQLLNDQSLRECFIEEGLKTTAAMNWDRLASIYFQDLKKLSKRIISKFERNRKIANIK